MAEHVDYATGAVVELLRGSPELQTILHSADARAQVVLVDFFAPWCGPCRMLGPVLESLAREHHGRLVVVKVDCEKTGANQALAQQSSISAYPTLHLYREAQRQAVLRGANPAALRSAIAEQLSALGPAAGAAPGAMAAALATALGRVKAGCSQEEFLLATKTLLAFVNNVLKNPDDPKYRRIKLANPAFQNRLGSKPGGVQCMEALGFGQRMEAMEALLVMDRISPQLQATKSLLEQALPASSGVPAQAPAPPEQTPPAPPAADAAALARALAQILVNTSVGQPPPEGPPAP